MDANPTAATEESGAPAGTITALQFSPQEIKLVTLPVVEFDEASEASFEAIRSLIGARLVEPATLLPLDGSDLEPVLFADEEGLMVDQPVLNRPLAYFTARLYGSPISMVGTVLMIARDSARYADVSAPDALIDLARTMPQYCD